MAGRFRDSNVYLFFIFLRGNNICNKFCYLGGDIIIYEYFVLPLPPQVLFNQKREKNRFK
jgi:hypothetical protein